jgi:hypothetical protein
MAGHRQLGLAPEALQQVDLAKLFPNDVSVTEKFIDVPFDGNGDRDEVPSTVESTPNLEGFWPVPRPLGDALFPLIQLPHSQPGTCVPMTGSPKAREAAELKNQADRGSREAQFQYRLCLEQGQGVLKDQVQAALYYKRAADQNHVIAQFNYAECLAEDERVDRDMREIARDFKLAADQNLTQAQFNYADCLAERELIEI